MSPLEPLAFRVEGMTCGSCALRVARALRKRGARKVRVDLVQEVVTLQRDPATTGDAAIRDALDAAGYRAQLGG